MTDEYPQPVVLDATVLSNFASTDGVSLLVTVLESPVVVPAVRDQLERGLDAGHEYLDTVVAALETDLPIQSLPSDSDFQEIRDRLDLGEAESLLLAIEHSGTLATDDLAARKMAEQRDVPVTGSIGCSCSVSSLVLSIERLPTNGSTRGGASVGTMHPSKV